jgi:HAD superfamily hydrolase (TIGR01549 family)
VIDGNLSLDGIQAILFDLDGTLRHSRPSYNHAFFDFAARFDVSGSDEKRRHALRWTHYYWASSRELLDDIQIVGESRDLLLTNYLRRYLIVYGCASQQAAALAPEIHVRMEEERQPEDWVDPDAPETLGTLKEAGFTLGVVSNRSKPFQDLLDRLGLGPYFEFALAAGEVNSYKPDAVIFQHAVRRAGARPECTMYVGDNYYADVVGAQRAGLQPVLLDPEEIFPAAECLVIRSLGELQKGLAG